MKPFNYETVYQERIVALLDRSRLPWHTEMLCSWFGCTDSVLYRCASFGRIWKCDAAMWASMKVYESPIVRVTHEMVERWIPKPYVFTRRPW